jgi:50S ribosomal protein L16 3-hydroxylase
MIIGASSHRAVVDNAPMDVNAPLALLGGLSPAVFMRRYWQKAPLLVRQALPAAAPLVARPALFALAGRDEVESRLVVRRDRLWTVRHGPLPRRALPAVRRPDWTLLVQGLDLHLPAAHELLGRFRFVPDARLDDLMLSWASDGGGVGPHLDSYDVFLVQLHGHRRWRVGRVADESLVDSAPLKILRRFVPEHDWLLGPGDLLYLPPRWGHDGVAEGECMTASVGFRVPAEDALARELLQRLADGDEPGRLYRDPRQPATASPAAIPAALHDFARRALERALGRRDAVELALGELLSEPKQQVWFRPGATRRAGEGVRPDAKTRMLYDERRVFVNGEAFEATGRDARLMRCLADERWLSAHDCALLSPGARELLADWVRSGWFEAGVP